MLAQARVKPSLLTVPSAPVARPLAPTDAELVAAAREGSQAALEALVRRHQRALFRLVRRYVQDSDVAADVTQRSFVRAMEHLGELRDDGTFRTWLFRTGINMALNHLRDHARFVGEAAADRPVAPEAPRLLEEAETARSLRAAIVRLPAKQRATLELRVFSELSFRDIARTLATTEGAAKVNFHYAVRNLRQQLNAA
jgi:RNA polymerase sigma-70 factor (ECF subfamily)